MKFIKLPATYLRSIAGDSKRLPKLYYHPLPFVRDFFWLRLVGLYKLARQYLNKWGSCLDFACGSGIFLPTLATMFESVVGVDLEIAEAERVQNDYRLSNVSLISGDISELELSQQFDAVFAADVLEHFSALSIPVAQIKTWLKPSGLLFTSLPTENFFTRLTRYFGGYKKPYDHYHTGAAVEKFLQQQGFSKIAARVVLPLYPLYYLGVWKKSN